MKAWKLPEKAIKYLGDLRRIEKSTWITDDNLFEDIFHTFIKNRNLLIIKPLSSAFETKKSSKLDTDFPSLNNGLMMVFHHDKITVENANSQVASWEVA